MKRLREEVSSLTERLEYVEGKRPLNKIRNDSDRIHSEFTGMVDSGRLQAAFQSMSNKAVKKRDRLR